MKVVQIFLNIIELYWLVCPDVKNFSELKANFSLSLLKNNMETLGFIVSLSFLSFFFYKELPEYSGPSSLYMGWHKNKKSLAGF